MYKYILILMTVVLLVPNLLDISIFKEKVYDQVEEYSPSLAFINSIDVLAQYTDSLAAANNITPASFEYVDKLTQVIRRRFYHGFSHFKLNENWVAALSGRLLEEGLGTKVKPQDIIQQGNAACSQQVIVMMAILRRKAIDYRHIAFPHHYALEVKIDSHWYFFDPNMEPGLQRSQRDSRNWNYDSDKLKQHYGPERKAAMDFAFGNGLTAERGIINEVPAKNANLFHSFTWCLSRGAWLLPVMLLWLHFRIRKKCGT